jgi:histidinol-phosphatase (PHP family)
MVEAAIIAGYRVFGFTEHAPRYHDRYLYAEEVEQGWDLQTLHDQFRRYALHLDSLIEKFQDRIEILRGFEAEIVPPEDYPERMQDLRAQLPFDYIVGSVHYVNDIIIDYTPELFQKAVNRAGGLEQLQVQYYQHLRDMVDALRPEVIGHFDLIRRFAGPIVPSKVVLAAAREALEAAAAQRCILDVNTGAYRKGLEHPYPAPEFVKLARDLNIPFCFGDDSHRPSEVGAGIDAARHYLLSLGVREVSCLRRTDGPLVQQRIAL